MEKLADRPHLLVCLTFPYRAAALPHLFDVLLRMNDIRSIPLDVRIFTDCMVADALDQLKELARFISVDAMHVSVEVQGVGSDPSLPLSWAHKSLLRSSFADSREKYTHFVYLDDLIAFSSRNLFYFLKYCPILRPYGLIPGFVQVEFSTHCGAIVVPDLPAPVRKQNRSVVDLGDIDFINLDAPFAPIHILDAELVAEYLASPASDLEASRDVIGWGDAQRSVMGLTFINAPKSHRWRVVVPIVRSRNIPHRDAWVHHVSNTVAARHATEPDFPLGRIRLGNMLLES